MDEYQKLGYTGRLGYLHGLADDYGLPFQAVKVMAEILGPSEDFDGLIAVLEDAESMGEFD